MKKGMKKLKQAQKRGLFSAAPPPAAASAPAVSAPAPATAPPSKPCASASASVGAWSASRLTMRAPCQPVATAAARFQPAKRRRVGLLWPLAQRAGVPLGSGLAARRPSPVLAVAPAVAADAVVAASAVAACPTDEVDAVAAAAPATVAAALPISGSSEAASPPKIELAGGVPLSSSLTTSTPGSATPNTTSSNITSGSSNDTSNNIASSSDASSPSSHNINSSTISGSNSTTSSSSGGNTSSGNSTNSTAINATEVAAETAISSADEKAYCSFDWQKGARLDTLLEASADAMFEAGAPLGKGGVGEVRRVAIDGAEYALKRSSVVSHDGLYIGQLAPLSDSGYIQVGLASAFKKDGKGASCEYSLYPLARGDLCTAWGLAPPGQQAAAPAVGAAPLRKGRTNTDKGDNKEESQESKGGKDDHKGNETAAGDDDKKDGKKKGGVCRRAARWLRKKVNKKKDDNSKQQPTVTRTPERPSADAFKAVAAEMVAALALLHGAGLRHNDIKPANYLVGRDGHLRLGDLDGICSASSPASSGDTITPLYAPAEQQQLSLGQMAAEAFAGLFTQCFGRGSHPQGPPADSRSADVWALGMSWVHMLLPDEQLFEVFSAVHGRETDDKTAAIAALSAALPEGLGDLVFGGMLRRNAGERLTIDEVKAHRFFEGGDWAAVGERRAALPIDLIARLEAATAVAAAKQESVEEVGGGNEQC